MIRKRPELDEFYRRLTTEENLSHGQSLQTFEALYTEALALGAINDENIMDGLETDLRIAKALNGLKP